MDVSPDDAQPTHLQPAHSPLKKILMIPRRMYDWTVAWSHRRHSTAALATISFAESSFFPIPPDVLLMPLCLGNRKKALWFGLVCTVASVLGAVAGYAIGYYLWDATQDLMYSYVPGFDAPTFAKVEDKFNEYGWLAILTAAVSPIPFKVFTIAGGVFAMNLPVFIITCFIGRGLRFFAVAGLMWWKGEPIKRFIERFFDLLSILFVVLLIGGFAAIKLLSGDHHEETPPVPTAPAAIEPSAG